MTIKDAVDRLNRLTDRYGEDAQLAINWWSRDDVESCLENHFGGMIFTDEEKDAVLRDMERNMDSESGVSWNDLYESIKTIICEKAETK